MADFGEILREWERIAPRKRPAVRKADEVGAADSDIPARKALEEALFRGADPSIKGDDETPVRPRTKSEIVAMPVEAVLDLHGQTATDAELSLSAFFRDAAAKGLSKVLIVHGKGLHSGAAPVLGKTVRRFLETSPLAGRHGSADRRSGGSGAVWVLIKGRDQRSR